MIARTATRHKPLAGGLMVALIVVVMFIAICCGAGAIYDRFWK